MPKVYVPHVVKDLLDFYDPVLTKKLTYHSVGEQIEEFAKLAYAQWLQKDYRSLFEFNNYNKAFIGKSFEEIANLDLSYADFLKTSLSSFGFGSDTNIESLKKISIDVEFEEAVDLMLDGDIEKLKIHIEKYPKLLNQQSNYGHRASLLQYAGSNGVEAWRQVVPLNLGEIISYFLSKGVDPDQDNNIYGMSSTLKGLIETSAHPWEAGIATELISILS